MAAGTGTQKELRVQIMDLQPGDLPAVRALELECFSDAWSEKLLQDLLTSSWDKAWVLKEDETVCGYSNFRVIAGEGELMRIAVHGASRGRGYGRLLMERLLREAEEENVEDTPWRCVHQCPGGARMRRMAFRKRRFGRIITAGRRKMR